MSLRRIKVQASRYFTRRGSCILFVILIWFLFYHLPAPPSTQNNTRADRPPPEHRVEDTARFIYRSPFRNDPNVQYEQQLSNALEEIEKAVLTQRKNKDWIYTLVTDKKAVEFLTNELSAIPEIATIYKSYPQNILRADLLRYLLLWYYGGFYADIDVFPARSIKACPALEPFFALTPDGYTKSTHPDISLVVGIEVDEPYASPEFMRDWHWTRSYGLIQYTMYAPRRFSPLLRETIVRVLAHTRQYNGEHTSFFPSLAYDEKTILGVTGPDVFTDAILDTLSSSLPSTHPFIQKSVDADADIGDLISAETGELEKRVTWAPFHRLRDPVCIQAGEAVPNESMGGLCVLPISVWGNGQRHSEAGGFNHPDACVNHRFGRTWKKGWWEYIFG
ncbi:CAZyme family GT32 [Penicillium roqueforti]|uniref:CAZyme family GT32 n=1 Tax=Penicillium roqueforti TaxID=5082 RepID=UPI001909DE0F|nr:CAZyme family GT32 [Penicillium roqueforti]KAF9239946.1 CAZyme family GT32 [Penicillium roqueforti]KAI2708283.1 CAZyme family GT32 [Penicillium roqueforti]KAI3164654.1 CAZyme family GT32 [Penicillium roqueforti]KAI3211978.1 CAZyme family GT32 [Penicillium roqueforti]KAI3272528.1 CAZyme family GT32 [Penicillium roqueforti]